MNEIKRCAIYCRKSHEEGLDQEFNSLDAQREAAQAYILTQRFNGWKAINKRYEDGGFSGANSDRPALKALLKDIEAGEVDIVLVYKIDRLSRSLLDFTSLFSQFEKYHVSFVSVTQQIDTSNPAGRMMLNILMTFAQYEREVIAERIRDKFSASRRKGMWMGGCVPVGYKVIDHRLTIVPAEADLIRWIFHRYTEVSSVSAIVHELNEQKRYHPSGRKWQYATVLKILGNVIYCGKVSYRGERYEGEHDAIIDMPLWESVQHLLQSAKGSPRRARSDSVAPLRGILRCGHCGCAMTPTYTSRKNVRYRYYKCHHSKSAPHDCPFGSISANEVERLVFDNLGEILRTQTFRALLLEAGVPESTLNVTLGNLPAFWNTLFPIERARLVQLLFERVTLHEDHLEFELKTNGMKAIIKDMQP